MIIVYVSPDHYRRDILYELASVGDLPLPQPSPTSIQKREREGDTPTSSPQVKEELPLPEGPRQIAGSKRVTQRAIVGSVTSPIQVHDTDSNPQSLSAQQTPHAGSSSESLVAGASGSQQPQQQQQSQQQFFSLPVYSEDLGRLPLHGQIEFSPSAQQPAGQSQQQYWYGGGNAQGTGSGSINVSVNVSVGNSGQVHRRSMDGTQGFEGHSGAATMTGSAGPGFGGMERPVPAGMFNQMDQVAMYPGGGRGVPSAAGPSPRPMGPPRNPPPSAYHHQTAGGEGFIGMAPHQHHPGSYQQYPTGGPHHQQGARNAPVQQPQQGYVDNDTMAMWSSAPTGFE